MKEMKETICHANYRNGDCIFDVERDVHDGQVEINLYGAKIQNCGPRCT